MKRKKERKKGRKNNKIKYNKIRYNKRKEKKKTNNERKEENKNARKKLFRWSSPPATAHRNFILVVRSGPHLSLTLILCCWW